MTFSRQVATGCALNHLPTFQDMKITHFLPLALAVFLGAASPAFSDEEPRVIGWDDLIPADWNPNSIMEEYTDEEIIKMNNEQYFSLQSQIQKLLDEAPTVAAMDGQTVKVPGFILPLEFEDTNISEFLLVPYFGACVHTPPPPANQIIHGKLDGSYAISELFEPVWISGKLNTLRSQQELGEQGIALTQQVDTGYTMEVENIEPYREEE